MAAFNRQRLTWVTPPPSSPSTATTGCTVELRTPKDIVFPDRGQMSYEVWASDPGGGRYLEEPGQIDRLWTLEVEGNLVVLASPSPSSSSSPTWSSRWPSSAGHDEARSRRVPGTATLLGSAWSHSLPDCGFRMPI